MNRTVQIALILPVVILSLLAGCTPQTSQVTVPVDTTKVFSRSGEQELPEKWWTAFGDPKLNTLVDSAVASNLGMRTAWQRLQAARAVYERESSALLPVIDASAQGELSKYQTEFRPNQQLRLGLSSSYEVDLWGRIRSRVQARQYRTKATLADYRTAALSVSGEIVRTWFLLMEAQNQLELVNNQIETNEKVLQLQETRFGSGQIRSADILRQRQLLESTREQKIAVESRIQVLEHQLAVLLGRSPQEEIIPPSDSLPEPPPLPETGLPAELIRRRPDVQNAYNLLKAADREVAAAISNQYPRFSLTASVSTAADNVDDLFRDWARSLAGNLLAPLFYGGQLRAEVDRTKSVKKQRLYEYGQTMLNAFREVEDALIREKKQLETIQSIKEQVNLAEQSYQQLRIEYFNGMGNYLDVLTALDEAQRLRRNLLSAKMTLLEYRIALYRSLAGGFETERETQQ